MDPSVNFNTGLQLSWEDRDSFYGKMDAMFFQNASLPYYKNPYDIESQKAFPEELKIHLQNRNIPCADSYFSDIVSGVERCFVFYLRSPLKFELIPLLGSAIEKSNSVRANYDICEPNHLNRAEDAITKFKKYHDSFAIRCPNHASIDAVCSIATECLTNIRNSNDHKEFERLLTCLHNCTIDDKPIISDTMRTQLLYIFLEYKHPLTIPVERPLGSSLVNWAFRLHQGCKTPFANTMRTVVRLAFEHLFCKKHIL
jgi:hypothetical protein